MYFALTVGILAVATGCDKSKSKEQLAAEVAPAGAPALDLAAKPELLFQVFGDSADKRILPLAAVVKGAVRQIGLTRAGWRELDGTYFATGTVYPLYRDDQKVGTATVKRGMWPTDGEALYSLAGCASPKPIGSVTLEFDPKAVDPSLEFVASTAPLATHAPFKGSLPAPAELLKLGRAFGHEVGKKAAMDEMELDSLDFHTRMIVTGASSQPTLLVSFIDPGAGDLGPGAGHTSHLFALGERNAAGGFDATYRHAVSGDAKAVEFQRLIDHADLDGDGIDELILEGWRYGADSDLLVLNFRNGQWHESVRMRQTWCLDPPTPK